MKLSELQALPNIGTMETTTKAAITKDGVTLTRMLATFVDGSSTEIFIRDSDVNDWHAKLTDLQVTVYKRFKN